MAWREEPKSRAVGHSAERFKEERDSDRSSILDQRAQGKAGEVPVDCRADNSSHIVRLEQLQRYQGRWTTTVVQAARCDAAQHAGHCIYEGEMGSDVGHQIKPYYPFLSSGRTDSHDVARRLAEPPGIPYSSTLGLNRMLLSHILSLCVCVCV